jgi:hypothetical protein
VIISLCFDRNPLNLKQGLLEKGDFFHGGL